ncbi:hypothetical protein [Mediterraneibacter faecis]|uniref:hypothetical protein n=1 Tax=Mediterraneibacter faecis TaxID=592978 RepID=UPI0022E6FB41|nr:hypothetical protein [Mediterraneibacter faecis]
MDEKINDEKALDCRDAIVDLKEQESKLIEQRFNNIKDEYDAILKQFEHTHSMLEGAIDITETSGYIVSTKYYDSLISNENEKINQLYAEREALVNSLNSALSSGKIDKYSESWYNMQDEIDSIDESIQDCNKSTIECGNSIRQIQWDLFDKLQDRISKINDEADFLKELMSSEKMYDDKNGGQITEYGKATFGLHGVKHNTLMAQADEYRKEMEKIDEQLKSDPFNQTLLDRRSELLKLQQESITSAKQEKDAIKDLVEDGINSQLDALQKLIDKYTDLLDTNKDMYDYQKQLAEKQKEISSIEKQLAAYQGDTCYNWISKYINKHDSKFIHEAIKKQRIRQKRELNKKLKYTNTNAHIILIKSNIKRNQLAKYLYVNGAEKRVGDFGSIVAYIKGLKEIPKK